MNKTAIKNFAIWARVQLIESVKQRAFEYEITENGENKPNVDAIGGRLLTADEKKQRAQLISQIKDKGYTQVMEEAAYTWFNRFIALRFMEVNGYLPSKIRVFTDENGAFKPEIMKEAMSVELEGLDKNKVLSLIDAQANEELYKYLLITQCNALNAGLPYMFEKIANWTELLFPANLLRNDSVVGQMISEIPEEDWTDAVQIIGWMYQYYNSELKDDTFALLKKNVKISKDRIPAATQLFTPDWIVRYMVENSLGRLWYEGHNNFDRSQWKYYLDEAEQDPEVEQQLKKIRAEYATIKPEEIKVIDPCMGSGHILVYAFDVLMQIYTSAGWSERDAAKSIIENNLYGLDIDDRAGQLAYFAVMMKARKYSRRILNGDVKPNVLSIQESNWMTDDFIAYVAGKDLHMKEDLITLRKIFKDAKEYGSIITVPTLRYDTIFERIDIISRSFTEDLFQAQYKIMAVEQLLPLTRQAQNMSQKYSIVVTNPPYAGVKGLSAKLTDKLSEIYPDSKADLFSAFIEKCWLMTKDYTAMVTPVAWIYNPRFEPLREKYTHSIAIDSLVELGSDAFEAGFGTVTFSLRKRIGNKYVGRFFDVSNIAEKTSFKEQKEYNSSMADFSEIDGSKFIYRVPENLRKIIKSAPKLQDYAVAGNGLQTNDNGRFIRDWFELDINKIDFSHTKGIPTKKKWFPTVKTTSSLKWYGNMCNVVNWENDGAEIKALTTQKYGTYSKHVRNLKYYFVEGLTWSHSTYGAPFSIRYMPSGTIINIEGPGIFDTKEKMYYTLGLLNSKVALIIFEFTTGSIHFVASDLAKFPYVYETNHIQEINSLVQDNIMIAKKDWDESETSWGFVKHPLIVGTDTICEAYDQWKSECEKRRLQLKANEEKLNSIFIEIYGLQNDLTPNVDETNLTIREANLQREIKSLISYAVGCIFGRYSVDNDGLCYAGSEWNDSKYKTIIPDADNIIPICDDDYFEDDIVGKFVDFVRKVYGKETVEQNLRFIADALGGKGTPREIIRNYFLNDFYSDHCATYSESGPGRRPIYWLFSSGKKNGFKALIYMHRYQPDLLARMRTDYVHEQQERYRTQLQMLEDSVQTAAPSERVKLNKKIAKLKDQSLELQKYEEKVHHLADQMISIDLDDGVKVNYAKFQDVLEKIK